MFSTLCHPRAFLIELILRTNGLWPFSRLNRIPYRLAIKVFTRVCARMPAVKSVFLRGGMNRGDWVAGLSDIDFTVILHQDLSPHATYRFLEVFWRKYAQMKWVFPMLGDIEIVSEEDLAISLVYTVRGVESRQWRLLFGEQKSLGPERPSFLSEPLDALNYALNLYVGTFQQKAWNGTPTYSDLLWLQRVSNKILRYVNVRSPETPRNITEMQSRMILSLSQAIQQKHLFEVLDDHRLPSSFGKHPSILSVYDSGGGVLYYVLRDGLSANDHASVLRELSLSFALERHKPIVLSLSMFTYLISIAEPIRHTYLQRGGRLLYGAEILPLLQKPSDHFFTLGLIDNFHYLIKAMHAREILNCRKESEKATQDRHCTLSWCMLILLFFKTGVVQTDFDALCNAYRSEFPHCYDSITKPGLGGLEFYLIIRGLCHQIRAEVLNLNGTFA